MTARRSLRRPPRRRRLGRILATALGCLLVLGGAFAAGRWWHSRAGQWSAPPSWKVWLGIAPRKSTAEAASRGDQPVRSAPAAPVLTFYQDLTAPLTPAPLPPRPKPAGAERAIAVAPPAVSAPTSMGRDERGGAAEGARFTIQVGAYRTRDAAEALLARLAAAGHDAYIAESEAPVGGIRYRVRVGSFVSQEAARAAAARLVSERQLSTYVTPR